MNSRGQPPDYGRRLIPVLIDEAARERPNDPFAFVAQTGNAEDSLQTVTYSQFANAINSCAWWMEAQVGISKSFDTLAYFGRSGLISCILMIAAIKTGHQLLLSSPRNTLEAHLNLLESTRCRVLISATPISPVVESILLQRSMRLIMVPNPCRWLDGEKSAIYVYNKTFDEARYEPFAVVHTSGSTGLPKAVTVTHGSVAASDAFNSIALDVAARPIVFEVLRNKRCFVSLPAFHIAGIDFIVVKPYYYGVVPVLPPADVPITAELVDAMHRLGNIQVSLLAPSVLHEIAFLPSLLQNLRCLNAVIYGGAPLPRETGDVIRSVTNIYSIMGSSEMYSVVTDLIDQEDWEYLAFNEMMGSQLRPHSVGLWELCLVRKPELELYQGIFSTFPALQEFRTNDLYSKHITKPNLWRYEGRADDIITLTNGEKLNPVTMEHLIGKHPDVTAVIVAGQARFQTALLVEVINPPATTSQRETLRQTLWPFIEEANRGCPAHGKLSRDLILFTHPAKPFSRSQKGTVQRRMTLSLYAEELNALYDAAKQNTELHLERPHMQDIRSLQEWLHLSIYNITGWTTDNATDLFSRGMDSLQVLQLVRAINSTLLKADSSMENVTAKTIYSNPTLEKMTAEIHRIIDLQAPNKENLSSGNYADVEEMQKLLFKTLRDMPIKSRRISEERRSERICIALTGSTGYIGSHIFNSILSNPKVHKIYCLNRFENAEERQRADQAAKALCTEWSPSRVEFLTCTISKDNFGLDAEHYDDMLQNVSHIVHNAWVVDFNLSLASFGEEQIIGVLQLLRFSAKSKHEACFYFLSSISAVLNWNLADSGPIPEQIITDWSVAEPLGYAQSKYVAERIIDEAAATGLPCAVWRIGQVAGPIVREGGMWNRREWFPSLIASSLFLGKIPASLGPNNKIEWVPVDSLSEIIMDLLDQVETAPQDLPTEPHLVNSASHDDLNGTIASAVKVTLVYNLVNPSSTNWQSLLPVIQAHYTGTILETVSLREWVDALLASISNIDHVDIVSENPAAKLLGFFQTLAERETEPGPSFKTDQAARASKTFRDLKPVNPEWMVRWLKQWNFENMVS